MPKPERLVLVALSLLLIGAFCRCEEHALVVPSGSQIITATLTRGSVRVEPATVHAGTVYVHVDSDGTELFFIGGLDPAISPRPGPDPLTDEHLAAVLGGDLYHTFQMSGLESGGQPNTGTKLELQAGKYLLMPYGLVTLAPGASSLSRDAVAVLEVVPRPSLAGRGDPPRD